MWRRSIAVPLALLALVGLGGATILADSPGKSTMPTFPPEYDDGRPLPVPDDVIVVGPTVQDASIPKLPGDLLELERSSLVSDDRAGVAAYVDQRREVLRTLPADKSAEVRVTFRSSVLPSEATKLLAEHGITAIYFEWEVPGTFEHGGVPAWELDACVATKGDVRLVHVAGWGPIQGLVDLSEDPRIWLVDPAGTGNYYWLAESVHALTE